MQLEKRNPEKSSTPIALQLVEKINSESGRAGWALLWLMGVPLPILLILYLIRGH